MGKSFNRKKKESFKLILLSIVPVMIIGIVSIILIVNISFSRDWKIILFIFCVLCVIFLVHGIAIMVNCHIKFKEEMMEKIINEIIADITYKNTRDEDIIYKGMQNEDKEFFIKILKLLN